MPITRGDFMKINSFILDNDEYGLYDNCSNFSSELWNTVSLIKVNPGDGNVLYWPTPEALALNIVRNSINFHTNEPIQDVSTGEAGYSHNSSFYNQYTSSWSTSSNGWSSEP